MTTAATSPSLAILPGRADEFRAELLLRLEADAAGSWRVAGTVVGPRRGRDMTLPTTVRLVGVGTEAAPDADARHVLARAVFTEPAYWTPELPNLYRLEARLTCGDRVGAVIDRSIGLRRLGVRGRSFWMEGRRWVPRGVTVSITGFDATELRGLSAAVVVEDPPATVCAAADTAGVAIIAGLVDVEGMPLCTEAATARIAAWSLHPSVVLAVVPATATADWAAAVVTAARPLKGTMLIGREVDGTRPPAAVPATVVESCDCLVVTLPGGAVPHEDWRSGLSGAFHRPLVARWTEAAGSMQECRRRCDQLQATLAAWGLADGSAGPPWDWAGYLV